jgi:hypothetical protein
MYRGGLERMGLVMVRGISGGGRGGFGSISKTRIRGDGGSW